MDVASLAAMSYITTKMTLSYAETNKRFERKPFDCQNSERSAPRIVPQFSRRITARPRETKGRNGRTLEPRKAAETKASSSTRPISSSAAPTRYLFEYLGTNTIRYSP